MARAGQRTQSFSVRELERLILLPAVRHLHIFLSYFRDHMPSKAIAEETGFSEPFIRNMLCETRHRLNIKRESLTVHSTAPQEWPQHIGLDYATVRQPVTDRGYRYKQQEVEEFFLAPARRRFEVARLFWVDQLTEAQIRERLGLTRGKTIYELMAVRRLSRKPQTRGRYRYSNRRRDTENPQTSGGIGPCSN
jgi:hypothetical protein